MIQFDFQWKPKSGIGLVVDPSGCQVAIASVTSDAIRLHSRPAAPVVVGDDPAASMSSQWLEQLKPEIGKGRFRLATAINSGEIFCKRVSLPSADPVEIGQMLPLQIEKWSPLPMEEVVWSYEILGTEGSNTDVLVVFGKRENLIRCAAQSGGEFLPSLIDVDLLVLWRALRARNIFEGKTCGALIWVDTLAKTAKCMLLKGSTPLLIEHLPVDGSDSSVLSRALTTLLLSTEATFGIDKLDEIFLFATDPAGVALGNQLGRDLGIPVTTVKPEEDLSTASGLARRALRKGEAQVNLLPVDFVQRQQKKVFRQQAKRVGAVVVAALIAVLVLFMAALGFRKHQIRNFDVELMKLNAEYVKALQSQEEVRFLKQKLRDPRSALETLRVVSDTMTEELALSYFGYKQGPGQPVDLRGTAKNAPDVYTFIDRLQKNGMFAQVKTGGGGIKNNPTGGVSFELSCIFTGTPAQPAAPPPTVQRGKTR